MTSTSQEPNTDLASETSTPSGERSLTTGHTNALLEGAARSTGLELGVTTSKELAEAIAIRGKEREVGLEARHSLNPQLRSQLDGLAPDLWGHKKQQAPMAIPSEMIPQAEEYQRFLEWMLKPADQTEVVKLTMRLMVKDQFMRSDPTIRRVILDNYAAVLSEHPLWAVREAVDYFIREEEGFPDVSKVAKKARLRACLFKEDRYHLNQILEASY